MKKLTIAFLLLAVAFSMAAQRRIRDWEAYEKEEATKYTIFQDEFHVDGVACLNFIQDFDKWVREFTHQENSGYEPETPSHHSYLKREHRWFAITDYRNLWNTHRFPCQPFKSKGFYCSDGSEDYDCDLHFTIDFKPFDGGYQLTLREPLVFGYSDRHRISLLNMRNSDAYRNGLSKRTRVFYDNLMDHLASEFERMSVSLYEFIVAEEEHQLLLDPERNKDFNSLNL